jgi:hypothetical protein
VVKVISIFGCVQNKFRNKPYVTCPVFKPVVKVLKKKIGVLNLTVWVQEQFENFAKTVWEPLETDSCPQ